MNGLPAVIYGIQQTRITLYDTNGNPTFRVGLQVEMSEGLKIRFLPEGIMHQLGSGAGWAQQWIHRGCRATLAIKWDVGVTSQIQAWGGSAWGAYAEVDTAQVLTQVLNSALLVPCKVEPHQDKAFAFQAQPVMATPFELSDLKRFAHRGLVLEMASCGLMQIPDWPTVNNYVAPGYIAPGYIGWVP